MEPSNALFFHSIQIATHLLKNRFVVAPMTRNSATSEGIPTDEMGEYYQAFATGGFAAIITEGVYTDVVAAICNPNQPGIVTSKQVNAWRKMTV